MTQTLGPGRGVVVVDRRPLERSLVRFILQENGFDVTAEASTPAEALRAVERRAPAVVVLHENAAWERGQPTIPLLRDLLPEAKVLVIAPAFGVVRVELLRDADAVLEEGVGFKDLPFVIGRLANGDTPRAAPAASTAIAGPAASARPRTGRWIERFQGASAAAVVFLALVLARGMMPPTAIDTSASVALTQARQHLEDLNAAAESQKYGAVLQDAVALYRAYTTATAAGVDTTQLEDGIVDMMNSVFPSLPPSAQQTLSVMFGDLPGITTSPEPTATPSVPVETSTETPSPTETPHEHPSGGGPPFPPPPVTQTSEPPPSESESTTPSPSDTESPSPSPSDTKSPSPSDTESPSPSPSDTESPSPSDTESPSPSPSDSESPSPTKSDTPSPSDTESPSPTKSDTPSPSDTGTPSPSESDSLTPSPTLTETPSPTTPASDAGGSTASDGGGAAAVLIVPPGLGIIASGIARRRARRSGR